MDYLFERPTPYQEFVAACRRYDRDALLALLSVLSRAWDGHKLDDRGRQLPQLPRNVVGVAATALQRGSTGGRRPTIEDAAYLSHMFSNLAHPGESDEEDYAIRLIARFLYQQWPYQRAQHHRQLGTANQPGVLDTTAWDELTIAAKNPILQQALSSVPIITLVDEGLLGTRPS